MGAGSINLSKNFLFSVSYMPVTQNGSYDVPVMARRDLHGEYRPYGSSSFSSSSHSAFSSPQKFFSNVRSQLVNSYSAIRDRLTHHSNQQQAPTTLLNSPTTNGGTRYTRSSSQSSTSGQTTGYNTRRRGAAAPVHSTPREDEHRKTSKTRKGRKSRDSEEEKDDEDKHKHEEDDDEHKHKHKHKHEEEDDDSENKDGFIVGLIKKILYLPFHILSFVWHKFFGLPWWLLIPLLLFLGFYACKSIISSLIFNFFKFSSSPFGM